MNQEALAYVKREITRAEARLLNYTRSATGSLNPTRDIVEKIQRRIEDFEKNIEGSRWIIMPGLRGVGKTTALAQTYKELRKRHPASRVLYISLDDAQNVVGFSLKEILEAYEYVLERAFEQQQEPYYLLIDEVQVDPKWASILKSLYDKSRYAFIFCTGSSAVSLQTNADVIRRATFEKLFPMCFSEFQMIKNGITPPTALKEKIKQAVYFSESIVLAHASLQELEAEVSKYWTHIDPMEIENYLGAGTLPFALHFKNTAEAYDAINKLLEKIISTDIASVSRFDSDTLANMKRLLFLVADSDVLSMQTLAKILHMSHLTIAAIFEVLEQAEVIVRALPYGSNVSKVKKPSKYLFMTPAIRASLLSIGAGEGTFATRRGRFIEDLVALHFYREFISPGAGSLAYDASKGGADFIVQLLNGQEIAIEVGSGEKGTAQVTQTMKERNIRRGLVISSHHLALSPDEKILFIPFSYFLLM